METARPNNGQFLRFLGHWGIGSLGQALRVNGSNRSARPKFTVLA